jgi:hypothetical protein
MRRILWFAATVLGSVAVWAQAPPPQVFPVPVPGGDVVAVPPVPAIFINQFVPGVGAGFDGLDAEPHGITNFKGVSAIGYTNGLATDNAGNTYQVITDIRVYQGDYIGAQSTFGAGGATSARGHGTFVEI